MSSRLARLAVAGALVSAVLLAGCGQESLSAPAGNDAEEGFLQGMVPHHQSAVAMAKVAQTEAQSDFVKGLAQAIVTSQTTEIAQMGRIHQRLFNAPLEPDVGGHMALGLSAQEAGMGHMDGAMMLRGKKPFDRAFIDGMVPHHQGATRMAKAVLTKTRDPELRTLAQEIIAAQEREIKAMSEFREREYGGPVPMADSAAAPLAG